MNSTKREKANLARWQNIFILSTLIRTIMVGSKFLRTPANKAPKKPACTTKPLYRRYTQGSVFLTILDESFCPVECCVAGIP